MSKSAATQGKKKDSSDYDANGTKLVFEVPCEVPQVTTVYRYIKQERFASYSPFNKKYHGDFYSGSRIRYTSSYLIKKSQQITPSNSS